jgi:hypothetical protein
VVIVAVVVLVVVVFEVVVVFKVVVVAEIPNSDTKALTRLSPMLLNLEKLVM